MGLPRTTVRIMTRRKAGKATKRQMAQKRADLTMGRILMATEKMARKVNQAVKANCKRGGDA